MDAFIKKIFLTCTLIVFSITTLNAIDLDKTYTNGEVKLVLNGQGIRDKFFIDLYVCGLYLPSKSSKPDEIINQNRPMSLKLHIVSSLISSDKMKNGTLEGFEKSTNGNMKPLQEKIDKFIGIFKEEIKKNDIYDFYYLPKVGVQISKNGILKKTIQGLKFKKALFGIWLGKEPAQDSLKKELLGQ